MKRKTRNFLTACLSVAMGSTMALSVAFALPKTVKADSPTAATSLIASTSGTVNVEATKTVNSHITGEVDPYLNAASTTGLSVSAETNYDAKFNAVFKGDLELQYLFPNTNTEETALVEETKDYYKNWGKDGQFQFTVASVSDPDVKFTYVHTVGGNKAHNNPTAYVSYTNATTTYVRTLNNGATAYYDYGSFVGTTTGWVHPCSGFETTTAFANGIKLGWENNVLTVYMRRFGAYNANNPNPDTITYQYTPLMSFDGTSTINGLTSCGIPDTLNEAFANGYTVSFSSSWETGTDVVFTSINGHDLATVENANVSDSNTLTGTDYIAVVNGVESSYKSGDTIDVMQGDTFKLKGSILKPIENLALDTTNLVYMPVGGGDVSCSPTVDTSQAGEQIITAGDATFTVNVHQNLQVIYMLGSEELERVSVTSNEPFTLQVAPTAVIEGKRFVGWVDGEGNLYTAEATHQGISETLTLTAVYQSYAQANTLIVSNKGTVTAQDTVNEHITGKIGSYIKAASVQGLSVSATGKYSATFNTVFKGDLELQYMFPNTDSTSQSIKNEHSSYQSGVDYTNGQFKFTIASFTNPDKQFTFLIDKGTGGTNANFHKTSASVEYTDENGVTYKRSNKDKTYIDAEKDTNRHYSLVSGFESTMFFANGIKLAWSGENNEILTVYMRTLDGLDANSPQMTSLQYDYIPLISFDGTSVISGQSACGIPDKLNEAFAGGYTVSFSSEYVTGTDVIFTEINGVALSNVEDFTFSDKDSGISSAIVDENGKTLKSGDTISVVKGTQSLPVYKNAYYEVNDFSADNANVYYGNSSNWDYDGELNLNQEGEYTLTTKDDESFSLKIKVLDELSVTYKDGENTLFSDVTMKNGEYTCNCLPDKKEGKTFLGWVVNANDGIYQTGATITVSENLVLQAVYMDDLAMVAGASVRLTEPTGIRFTSKILASDWEKIQGFVVDAGTVIMPRDSLGKNTTFTKEYLETTLHYTAGNHYLDIKRTTFLTDSAVEQMGFAEGYKYFAGSMTDVKAGNYAREFIATSYIVIGYADGSTAIFYSDYNETDNCRSIYEVATKALAAGETDDVLHGYVDSVADITVGADYTFTKANQQAGYTVDSTADTEVTGKYTLTLTQDISSIMLNGTLLSAAQNAVNTIVVNGVSVNVTEIAVTHNGESGCTITFTLSEVVTA